jgi:hypothetical protein
MSALVDQITTVITEHYGGWIDNGNTDKAHCTCGYRPSLGEFHGRHVAERIAAAIEPELQGRYRQGAAENSWHMP